MSPWFLGFILGLSLLAGCTASVVGFGIGSLLMPLVAFRFGTDNAVVLVSLPHLAGSLLRGWRLRRCIDRVLLLRFGLLSGAGGLVGALLFERLAADLLTRLLGALLILTAVGGFAGKTGGWQPRGSAVWILGAFSGFFGGMVGNQGGLRAAAMIPFRLPPATFVATSTAVTILVDLARTPVYLLHDFHLLRVHCPVVVLMTAGVLAGTFAGERFLRGLSAAGFKVAVSVAIGGLGIWFLCSG